MRKGKSIFDGLLRGIGIFVMLLFCLFAFGGRAYATEVDEPQPINITFSAKEYITNSHYFQDIPFTFEDTVTFSMLLEKACEQGYLKEYLFEEDWLVSVTFQNGTTLTKGGYGDQSGFYLVFDGALYPPYALTELIPDESYTLQYKLSYDNNGAWLTTDEKRLTEETVWNESWNATLDSACDWLYYNRTRGSKQAIMALGIARRPANPTDIVLLTQLTSVNTENCTELIQTVYAAAYSGYSHPTVGDRDLFLLLQNYCDPAECLTEELCAILRLYDAFDFDIDTGVALSRGAIVGELLERVNDDGGFCPRRWRGSSIEATANAIAVLQEYRDLSAVDTAVLDGISYLSSPQVRDELFDPESTVTCSTVSRMIIAMCSCHLPFHDVYFTKDGSTYADLLLQYMSVSGGFSELLSGTEDETATALAVVAMCAMQKQGDPYLSDATLVALQIDAKEENKAVPATVSPAQPPTFFLQIKGGFWLALGSVAMVFVIQIIRYLRKKKKEKRSLYKDT